MVDNDTTVNRRTYLRTAGTVGALGMGGLAGCTLIPGGDGGGGSDTLTIGATVPRSGQFSSLGSEMEQGYQLGVAGMNQDLNREVELILQDDESDPAQVRRSLQQITSNSDVDMLWGSFSSLLATAGSAFAENQDVPFFGAFFSYEGPHRNEGYEWTYVPFPKSRDVARSTRGLLDLVPQGQRPSRVGIWEPNTGWGQEQAGAWEGNPRRELQHRLARAIPDLCSSCSITACARSPEGSLPPSRDCSSC